MFTVYYSLDCRSFYALDSYLTKDDAVAAMTKRIKQHSKANVRMVVCNGFNLHRVETKVDTFFYLVA